MNTNNSSARPDLAYMGQLERDGEKFAVTLESTNTKLGKSMATLVRQIVEVVRAVVS